MNEHTSLSCICLLEEVRDILTWYRDKKNFEDPDNDMMTCIRNINRVISELDTEYDESVKETNKRELEIQSYIDDHIDEESLEDEESYAISNCIQYAGDKCCNRIVIHNKELILTEKLMKEYIDMNRETLYKNMPDENIIENVRHHFIAIERLFVNQYC